MDKHVIGEYVRQAGPDTPLREAGLVAFRWSERKIEVPDQLKRAAADVHAVPGWCREPRAEAQGTRSNRRGSVVEAPFPRRSPFPRRPEDPSHTVVAAQGR